MASELVTVTFLRKYLFKLCKVVHKVMTIQLIKLGLIIIALLLLFIIGMTFTMMPVNDKVEILPEALKNVYFYQDRPLSLGKNINWNEMEDLHQSSSGGLFSANLLPAINCKWIFI